MPMDEEYLDKKMEAEPKYQPHQQVSLPSGKSLS
jgi:hypothetical protein